MNGNNATVRHIRTEKENRTSYLFQRLLRLLLGTGEKVGQ